MIWIYILGYVAISGIVYVQMHNKFLNDAFNSNFEHQKNWYDKRRSEAEMAEEALEEAKRDLRREDTIPFICGLCAAFWPIAGVFFTIRAIFRLAIKALKAIPLMNSAAERKVDKLKKAEATKLAQELAQKEVIEHYQAMGIDTKLIEKAWKL